MKNSPTTVTVKKPTTDPATLDTLFHQIDASLDHGQVHPGYDCFLLHSTIVPRINLHDLFVGSPPWGSALAVLLEQHLAKHTYKNVRSNPRGTFHLGDDKAWGKNGISEHVRQQAQQVLVQYRADIENCPKPLFAKTIEVYINTANCGKVFAKLRERQHERDNAEKQQQQWRQQRLSQWQSR